MRMNLAAMSQLSPRPPPYVNCGFGFIPMSSFPVTLSISRGIVALVQFGVGAVRTESEGWRIRNSESYGYDLLRKPSISPENDLGDVSQEEECGDEKEAEAWVDWEDRILEDTVPLVGFVRMLIHSGKYGSGDRLSPEHERMIIEKLLPYHPEFEKKTESGIDYITVGHHPDFERSRCLFIVRKDGEFVDFSYWKCIKGLIRKNYPLYADNFILRHFRMRRQNR